MLEFREVEVEVEVEIEIECCQQTAKAIPR